jgi:hypothetical protein
MTLPCDAELRRMFDDVDHNQANLVLAMLKDHGYVADCGRCLRPAAEMEPQTWGHLVDDEPAIELD